MELPQRLLLWIGLVWAVSEAPSCFKKQADRNGVDICSCDKPFSEVALGSVTCEEAFSECAANCYLNSSCVSFNIIEATSNCLLFEAANCMAYSSLQCSNFLARDMFRELYVAVDNVLVDVYIDEENLVGQIAVKDSWSDVGKVTFPYDARVIAVYGQNEPGGYGGLMVRMDDSYMATSNLTWKCLGEFQEGWFRVDFDDSKWPLAGVVVDSKMKYPKINLGVDWIWATDLAALNVYCRSKMAAYRNIKV